MTAEDVRQVARVHLQALPEDFCGRLGAGFLESAFYPHFLEQDGGAGLVAVDGAGAVQGFVVGAAGHGYYTKLLRRRAWPLLVATMSSLLKRPSLLAYYADVAKVMMGDGFHPGPVSYTHLTLPTS